MEQHANNNPAASDPAQSALTLGERFYLREAVRGMVVVARHFWRNLLGYRDPNPEVMDRKGAGVNLVSTINYPDEQKPYPPGYRGMHRLVPRVDGRPRCVACYMCATACPAQCIYIEAGEYENDAIEKYPIRFEIDELRCIVCGFCVEACPKDAIRMDTGTHAPAVLSRPLAVFDKEALLQGPAVEHPSDVLTYRMPLKTIALPPDEQGGSGH
jgi:NADH-quinone oxidoreductase subunit I